MALKIKAQSHQTLANMRCKLGKHDDHLTEYLISFSGDAPGTVADSVTLATPYLKSVVSPLRNKVSLDSAIREVIYQRWKSERYLVNPDDYGYETALAAE